MDLIVKRRSIRKYKETAVEEDKIQKILEAIRLAPSALNRQGWVFYVVRDRERIQRVADAAGIFPWLYRVPVILVGCGTTHECMTNKHNSDTVDVSIAMSFAMLEAQEQGLGTCWMAHFDPDKMRKALDADENENPVVLMPLGYADEHPAARKRKEIAEIARFM